MFELCVDVGPQPVVKKIAKVDWFADLHGLSATAKLTLVGGACELL